MPARVVAEAETHFDVEIREENTPLKPGQMRGALALYDGILPTLGDMFSAEVFEDAEGSRCRILANFGVGLTISTWPPPAPRGSPSPTRRAP